MEAGGYYCRTPSYLVLREELVPLLDELIQVGAHIIISLGQYFAVGESYDKAFLFFAKKKEEFKQKIIMLLFLVW